MEDIIKKTSNNYTDSVIEILNNKDLIRDNPLLIQQLIEPIVETLKVICDFFEFLFECLTLEQKKYLLNQLKCEDFA